MVRTRSIVSSGLTWNCDQIQKGTLKTSLDEIQYLTD